MTNYNALRSIRELLAKHETSPPSFTVHLYPEHWTLNNGSKFLYNNPVASLLDDIRAQRIPVDFLELFETAGVPFYEGCMIVELLDYRPIRNRDPVLEKPLRTRVVLQHNDETLWADLCLLQQRSNYQLTDQHVLELESRVLLATTPSLCLDPDPHLGRIANDIARVSAPSVPPSLKRKAAALEQEEDEAEKTRRIKVTQFMNPRLNRVHGPSYRLLDFAQSFRSREPPAAPTPQVRAQSLLRTTPSNGSQAHTPLQPPVQQPTTQPMQQPLQQPVQQPVQQPIQQPIHQPIQQPIQRLVQQPVPRPMQPPMHQPVHPPANQPLQQPVPMPAPTSRPASIVPSPTVPPQINNGQKPMAVPSVKREAVPSPIPILPQRPPSRTPSQLGNHSSPAPQSLQSPFKAPALLPTPGVSRAPSDQPLRNSTPAQAIVPSPRPPPSIPTQPSHPPQPTQFQVPFQAPTQGQQYLQHAQVNKMQIPKTVTPTTQPMPQQNVNVPMQPANPMTPQQQQQLLAYRQAIMKARATAAQQQMRSSPMLQTQGHTVHTNVAAANQTAMATVRSPMPGPQQIQQMQQQQQHQRMLQWRQLQAQAQAQGLNPQQQQNMLQQFLAANPGARGTPVQGQQLNMHQQQQAAALLQQQQQQQQQQHLQQQQQQHLQQQQQQIQQQQQQQHQPQHQGQVANNQRMLAQYQQMMNYSQNGNANVGQGNPSYPNSWPIQVGGVGRGAGGVNQLQMQGMVPGSAHAQQMALQAGKVPTTMPGR
ncbi:hypothetical protein PUNSTDRAFT_143012 [Punctularia strigosozonata HHB-11173 SS5]|uniref:uncharacterized protein n=1 Tax=Punctularia strigosozonata (strain HHB-11173) TaxID=741275 RepID=UPI0004416FE9|nr:uncharacterized protein PUNSTDRAFT_143012 [Punctularia strigosozonata HHB-11173 SS5]EIN09455.1 hypothetical protein PUNSTDRAFT_143012 [Punctularia strigosozonata HHB-11173 SS5]